MHKPQSLAAFLASNMQRLRQELAKTSPITAKLRILESRHAFVFDRLLPLGVKRLKVFRMPPVISDGLKQKDSIRLIFCPAPSSCGIPSVPQWSPQLHHSSLAWYYCYDCLGQQTWEAWCAGHCFSHVLHIAPSKLDYFLLQSV